MENQQIFDLSKFPKQARIELMDFYEFLAQKYVGDYKKINTKKERFSQFLEHPIKITKLHSWTREELHER